MTAEQQELMRMCAQRMIEQANEGRILDPRTLKWAQWTVLHVRPLGRPIGTGEGVA